MATRWFGPRPVYHPIATGWPDLIVRHGSCGCCGCGGRNADGELVKYAAYRDGLRLKLTIEDVPDGFSMYLDGTYPIYLTDATGMSQFNGTWYFDLVRTQYGCIWNATDSDQFDIAYVMTDPDFYPDGIPYTQRVILQPRVSRVFGGGNDVLNFVSALIEHFSPDYYTDVVLGPLPYASYAHPMIGLAFEPSDSEFFAGAAQGSNTEFGVSTEERSTGWRPDQLNQVITGNLRFYLDTALGDQDPLSPDLTDSDWVGTDVFWDFGASEFKIAGTFTAEIERL